MVATCARCDECATPNPHRGLYPYFSKQGRKVKLCEDCLRRSIRGLEEHDSAQEQYQTQVARNNNDRF